MVGVGLLVLLVCLTWFDAVLLQNVVSVLGHELLSLSDDRLTMLSPFSTILSARFYRKKQKFYSTDFFYLHLISDTIYIFHDILGPGWKLLYLIDSFYLENRVLFGRSAH